MRSREPRAARRLAISDRAGRRARSVLAPMRLLDPKLNDLTPRHLEVYWLYQVVRTGVDFGAAVCFVIGSAVFVLT